jgi:hypothetical protein
LSERVRESREEGMLERERRWLTVAGASVVEKRRVEVRDVDVMRGWEKARHRERRVRAMTNIGNEM